nr:chitin-binding lectin 1-like [Quercus suber]
MLPSLFTLLLIILHCNLSLATPSTPTKTTADSNKNQTVSKKDQIACTVCNECENPCPVPSPPPPVVEYPPPPPPALPPPELQECPPPPQLPCPGNCYTPSPPSGPTVEPFPPNGPKPYPSPPNPMVPYFPYYYYYPPGSSISNSLHLKLNPFVSSIVIFLTSLLCFF